LLAAEYRGDIDNVLDRARRHLEEDHATTDLEIENGAMTSTGRTIQGVFPKMRYIFISHASADKPLADLFRETLVLGGVPAEVPFYSAARERLPEPKRVSESLGNKQKISLSNETAVNTPYGTEVHGEATNNNAVEHPPPSKQHFMTPAVALLEQ
jgi:hypothetical protein